MLGSARECWGILGNAGECWGMLGNPGECWGNAGECWGVLGVLRNAGEGLLGECWGMLRNAGECWGVLGAGGMLGENARGMLGECRGILGNARECLGGCFFPQVFLQCMRVGQLELQNKNALPVPLLRQVYFRVFLGVFGQGALLGRLLERSLFPLGAKGCPK